MALPFAKLHGAGNDYIAIDGRDENRDWGELSRAMSELHFGAGSDGIVVVLPSDRAQVRMRIFNPDGSEAEMSGNGVRLFSKFVIDRNIAIPGPGGLHVETMAGIRTIEPTMDGGVMVAGRVAMGAPLLAPAEIPVDIDATGNVDRVINLPIDVGERSIEVTCLSVGNPHAVHFPDGDVDDFPLLEIGPRVESHELFPNRINFEIANVIDRGHIKARIFERGAGETLSSGTGSSAVCVAARLHNLIDENVEISVPGGILKLSWDGKGEVYLEGPTVEVYTGIWPE
ncbi:MAG: diaminopimelate epimerase [Chloroflexi bacterium]|nr:diaminopimelate epimerase [Chloroflexota bacterium]